VRIAGAVWQLIDNDQPERQMDIVTNGNEAAPLPYHLAPPISPETKYDCDLAQHMVDRIIGLAPKSGAEALRQLRIAFPESPLTLRVTVLDLLMRRGGTSGAHGAK
jgi:hypothetical protein